MPLRIKLKFRPSILLLLITICFSVCTHVEAAPRVSRPKQVTGVKAIVTEYNTVKVEWKKQDVTGYRIYRSTKKNSGYKLVKTTKKNSWENKNLTTGKRYYFKVKAYNESGKTKRFSVKYSSVVSAVPKVGAPTNMNVTCTGYRSLKIIWKAGKYATGYQIYRSKSKDGKYSKIDATSSTSYTNSNLITGETYYYKVRAYKKVGEKYKYSSFCSVVSGKPILSKPTEITAEKKNGSIRINWKAVQGAAKYYLYRSDGEVFTTTKAEYTDNSVKRDVDYRYRVRAYRNVYSKYSSYTKYLKVLSVDTEKVVEDTVLYTINEDNELEYNTLYEGEISPDVFVNGCDINTMEELQEVLGTEDSPKAKVGTTVGDRTLGDCVTADLGYSSEGDIVQITVKSIEERPVVGISWKSNSVSSFYKRCAEIFERNGAYVVFLPKAASSEEAASILRSVNGVFFTGGDGWMPKFYNDVQTPHGSNKWNETRDISDLHMLKQAIAMDVPLLSVCRNMQGLNIALGGGLIQDVPYYLGQKVLNGEISEKRVTKVLSGKLESIGVDVKDKGYRMYDSETGTMRNTYDEETGEYVEGSGCEEGHLRVVIDGIVHQSNGVYHELAFIDTDSKWLYDIFKADELEEVASAHHQAINPEKLGDGLTIVAKSSDGVVEAVEYQKNLFALGLQWHPEKFLLNNTAGLDQEICNAPMAALVKYAGIHNIRNLTPQ